MILADLEVAKGKSGKAADLVVHQIRKAGKS